MLVLIQISPGDIKVAIAEETPMTSETCVEPGGKVSLMRPVEGGNDVETLPPVTKTHSFENAISLVQWWQRRLQSSGPSLS